MGLPLAVHANTAVPPAASCWMVGVASTTGRAVGKRDMHDTRIFATL